MHILSDALFAIRERVNIPESICSGKMAGIISAEYQPPTHGPLSAALVGVDCSGWVYHIKHHSGTIYVSERQLLQWNPHKIPNAKTSLNAPANPQIKT